MGAFQRQGVFWVDYQVNGHMTSRLHLSIDWT